MEINTIGVLLFDDVELLDFAGPLEVFGAANYLEEEEGLFTIETVAHQKDINVSKSLLKVTADNTLNGQGYDLFIIPGGFGTRQLVKDESLLQPIQQTIENSKLLVSVCTGSLVLAKLGYLKDKEVCSHHLSYDLLTSIDPSITVNKEARYMDHGLIMTAAGVSAGIDLSFHILRKFYGKEAAAKVRQYIEYFPEEVE